MHCTFVDNQMSEAFILATHHSKKDFFQSAPKSPRPRGRPKKIESEPKKVESESEVTTNNRIQCHVSIQLKNAYNPSD